MSKSLVDRRAFVMRSCLGHCGLLLGAFAAANGCRASRPQVPPGEEDLAKSPPLPRAKMAPPPPEILAKQRAGGRELSVQELTKMRDFDRTYPEDKFATPAQIALMTAILAKLQAVERHVGYGQFNILGFDQALNAARRASGSSAFSRTERNFCDELFNTDARVYGFYGERLHGNITTLISPLDVIKIPRSGHYLFRETALPIYAKIRREIGESLVLTSGVRGITKQFSLFLAKSQSVNFNLSQASRSLAPPGYSFHGVGDFDIGKQGLGLDNFTHKFSETDEFKRLTDLGYVDIRYPLNNPFGVRFEPWHIEGLFHRHTTVRSG